MRRILIPVLTAHYLAAFTALGIPVFLPKILSQLAPQSPVWLAGVLYVLPTICTALTAAGWGRIADRYGRKLSLMRAQIGLALGFVLAGLAPNLGIFVLALIIQGSCGGSLAAANAYLATQLGRGELSRALDWTQFSARLAMLTGPVLLGLAIDHGSPQRLYAYLSLLPLLGLCISLQLPPDSPTPRSIDAGGATRTDNLPWGLLAIQFLYYFAVVVTFPYFVSYCHQLGIANDALAGLLYSLPHLIYLIALPWLRLQSVKLPRLLGLGLFVLSGASLLQALPLHPAWLAVTRTLYGAGMTLTICSLNYLLSRRASQTRAGRLFGVFDACGKWAGAAGGLAAGLLVHHYALAAPFVAAAIAGTAALLTAILVSFLEKRSLYVAASDA
jgi:MFS family permease